MRSLLAQFQETVLTTAQVRAVDRDAIANYHMHSLVLMENAALNCVSCLVEEFEIESPPKHTVVLCGRGNNGGDGLAIARHLRCRGWYCTVVLCGPVKKLSKDVLCNWNILTAHSEASDLGANLVVNSSSETASTETQQRALASICTADVILDAMLGTGFQGALRPPFETWVQAANASSARRIAIDVPTGVNADTGPLAQEYFSAHETLTFVAQKPAMVQTGNQPIFGKIVVLPIGLPPAMLAKLVNSRGRDSGGGSEQI